MIDAAGAIYVIGGEGDGTWYQDVWVSTDGGARPDLNTGVLEGVHQEGYSGDTAGALEGCSRGTMGPQMVPTGYWGT